MLHMEYPTKYNVFYYFLQNPFPMKNPSEKQRHFYILYNDRNKLENYNENEILKTGSAGNASIYISYEDSWTIVKKKPD